MRLNDIRRRRDDAPVPPQVEAELEALDAAIRGEEIPAGDEALATLVADLRTERPQADPEFNAALDSWAAEGFPRGGRPGLKASQDGNTGRAPRLSLPRGRRWLPVAAAAATAVVVVGVSVSQLADERGGEESVLSGPETPSTQPSSAEDAPPAPAGALRDADADFRAGLEAGGNDTSAGLPARGLGKAKNLPGRDRRLVDRDAALTLAAPADEVPDVTNRAIGVVEAADGVVLSSLVTGTDGAAQATLSLQVPTAELDTVLAGLSDLADVRSRSERAEDITESVVTARDRLVGLRAERDNLAGRIRDADSDAEVEALQNRLDSVNRQIAGAKDELAGGRLRARISTIDLQITSQGAGEDGWSLGDALDDAGRVLEVAAGIALVSGAVLLPLALLGAVTYAAMAASHRRARERALDD